MHILYSAVLWENILYINKLKAKEYCLDPLYHESIWLDIYLSYWIGYNL